MEHAEKAAWCIVKPLPNIYFIMYQSPLPADKVIISYFTVMVSLSVKQ